MQTLTDVRLIVCSRSVCSVSDKALCVRAWLRETMYIYMPRGIAKSLKDSTVKLLHQKSASAHSFYGSNELPAPSFFFLFTDLPLPLPSRFHPYPSRISRDKHKVKTCTLVVADSSTKPERVQFLCLQGDITTETTTRSAKV